MPAVLTLAVTYVTSALAPALRAECRRSAADLVEFVYNAKRLARGLCMMTAWLYVAVALHVGAMHLLAPAQSTFSWWGAALASPVASGRGFLLGLHAFGLACAEARKALAAALGRDLFPLLVGAQMARKLTIKALALKHGPRLLRHISTFRRCAPPQSVVAVVVAVRRTAPVLLPMTAVILQLAQPHAGSYLCLALLLALALSGLVAVVAMHEFQALPEAPLRRLPLLLPSGFTPLSRRLIGHSLCAAERLEGAWGGLSALCASLCARLG